MLYPLRNRLFETSSKLASFRRKNQGRRVYLQRRYVQHMLIRTYESLGIAQEAECSFIILSMNTEVSGFSSYVDRKTLVETTYIKHGHEVFDHISALGNATQ